MTATLRKPGATKKAAGTKDQKRGRAEARRHAQHDRGRQDKRALPAPNAPAQISEKRRKESLHDIGKGHRAVKPSQRRNQKKETGEAAAASEQAEASR